MSRHATQMASIILPGSDEFWVRTPDESGGASRLHAPAMPKMFRQVGGTTRFGLLLGPQWY